MIVDLPCAMAVLRGAEVFAQGVLAAPPGRLTVAGYSPNRYTEYITQCTDSGTRIYMIEGLY